MLRVCFGQVYVARRQKLVVLFKLVRREVLLDVPLRRESEIRTPFESFESSLKLERVIQRAIEGDLKKAFH